MEDEHEYEALVDWEEWKTKLLKKKLFQCHSVHHKSHLKFLGSKSGPPVAITVKP